MLVKRLNYKTFFLTFAFVAAFAFRPADALSQTLEGVRVGAASPTQSRIVADLDAAPRWRVSGEDGADPVLILSLEGVAAPQRSGWLARPKGLVKAVSTDARGALEIRFAGPVKVAEIFLIEPNATSRSFRLVIDVEKAPQGAFLANLKGAGASEIASADPVAAMIEALSVTPASQSGAQSGAEPGSPPTVAATPPARRPVIVIDAGHGGNDPGAIGPSGVKESVVTLAAARKLAEFLNRSNRYDVVMTRSDDSRVAHTQRSSLARKARADLFISIHADAHSDADLRGGSVYTLSEEGAARSAREAREQGNYVVFDYDIAAGDPILGDILYDVAQDMTETESSRFADILISRLVGVTPLVNNSHRRGNLKVLLAPDVPAVLLELAFISNPDDEANLNSKAWRRKTMASVAAAIDAYFRVREADGARAAEAAGGTGR